MRICMYAWQERVNSEVGTKSRGRKRSRKRETTKKPVIACKGSQAGRIAEQALRGTALPSYEPLTATCRIQQGVDCVGEGEE